METIKYCESDVITLYKVIKKFQKRIFHYFDLDILKYPTLPSLAFAIFRAKYLKKYEIGNLIGETYNFISKGYTGGAVDLYFNRNEPNEEVYRYDVNSLYPSVMNDNNMPIGHPIQFDGNILDPNIFNNLNSQIWKSQLH